MKKFLYYFLLFIPSLSFSQNLSTKFLNESNNIIQETVQNYKMDIQSPLGVKIFDIGNPIYYNFLSYSTSHTNYKNDKLALVYLNNSNSNLKINNEPASFCFILYNSKDKLFLKNFLDSQFFSWDNMLLYLNYHELGHCFAAHQAQYNNNTKMIDSKHSEAFADMFVIAMLLNQKKEQEALSVISLNKSIDPSDIHYNPIVLEKFFNEYKKNLQYSDRIKTVFDNAYNIFSTIIF